MHAPSTRTAILALLCTLAPTAAIAQGNYPYGPHMWGGGGWMGWLAMPVMMLAMVAILVAIVVLVIRWLGGAGQASTDLPPPPERTPLDILKERYARGEIDKAEYEERKRVLEG